jgi:PAS domain S-box-containing protein
MKDQSKTKQALIQELVSLRLRIAELDQSESERKRDEIVLRLDEARLESLFNISQYKAETIQDLLDYALDEAITLTGSKIGYIYFYDDQKKEFILNTWSKDVMRECTITEPQSIYHLEKTGMWGEAVRQGKPIILNDFQAPHPLKKGYPEGHAKLYKYMTIPVFAKDKIVAVVAVANKATDYNQSDIRQLTLLMDSVWKIAESKRGEEALKQSEEKYRTVADFTYDWEYWLAPNGKYIYISPACESISGYRVEEFHQDPKLLNKIIHPDDRSGFACHIQDVLQGKSDACELEFRIVTRDGKECWISHVCQDVHSHTGEYLGRRGSNRVITDRKLAEEALKEKDKFLESIIQSSAVATFVINAEHKVIYWNKACEDLTGMKSEDLLGTSDHWKPFYDHPRPCVADVIIDNKINEMTNFYKVYAKSVLIPDGIRAEGWYPNLGGKNRYIVFDAAPIRDDNGKLIAAIETLQDITKRKQAEDALQEGQRQLKAILDNIPDIAWLKDRESRFIAVNEPFGKSCGFEPENLVGKTDFDIWSKDLAERYSADDKEVMESGKRKQVEEPLTDSEGKVLWIETTKTPIHDDQGNVVGTAGIARDITGRKRVDVKLRQQTNAMDAAIDGMALLNEEEEYVYLNKAHAKVYGYENAGELIGKSWRILYDADVIQRFEQEIMPELSRKGDWFGESIGTKKSGSKFPQELSLTAMANGGLICVVRDITDRKRAEEQLQHTLESLRKAFGTTVQVMVSAIESRDPYTAGHQIRSTDLARSIAKEMELSQDKIDGIRMAGVIHDIGKLSIPAEILSKPKKLTEIEFSLIKEHARTGYEMLKDVESPWPLAEIVHQHHERMDGSGYPRNLKGDEILMEARIMAIADVVESMASHRPYRPALGLSAALEEIENKGTLCNEVG